MSAFLRGNLSPIFGRFARVAAQRLRSMPGISCCLPRFTCKTEHSESGRCWFRTSVLCLVRQIHNVVVVHRCSEIPAKPSFYGWVYSSLFAVVRVGWCTNGCSPGVPTFETISTTPGLRANLLSWPWPTHLYFRYASSLASRQEGRAEAFSFGPSLLLGIYVNFGVLRKRQPRLVFPAR
jgi:hypothetical protein